VRKNRKYTKQFKLDCVKHMETSGKSARSIAKDLGVNQENLSRWKRELSDEKGIPFTGQGNPRDEELFNLKKELRVVKEEREILKKAMAIFSKET